MADDEAQEDEGEDETEAPLIREARSPLDLLKRGSDRLFKIALGMVVGEAIALAYLEHWKKGVPFSALKPSEHLVLWLFLATAVFAIAVQPGKSRRNPFGDGAELEFPRDVLRLAAIVVSTALGCAALARTIEALGL